MSLTCSIEMKDRSPIWDLSGLDLDSSGLQIAPIFRCYGEIECHFSSLYIM